MLELPVLLVLQQLTVPASQSVTGLTVKLQWLLLVDGTEHRPLSCSNRLCRHTVGRNKLRGKITRETMEAKKSATNKLPVITHVRSSLGLQTRQLVKI